MGTYIAAASSCQPRAWRAARYFVSQDLLQERIPAESNTRGALTRESWCTVHSGFGGSSEREALRYTWVEFLFTYILGRSLEQSWLSQGRRLLENRKWAGLPYKFFSTTSAIEPFSSFSYTTNTQQLRRKAIEKFGSIGHRFADGIDALGVPLDQLRQVLRPFDAVDNIDKETGSRD